MKLDNLGNFRNFENPPRLVKPLDLIATPNLILKGYDMYTEKPSEIETIVQMENFLKQEIEEGKIDPRIGLGFAILSKNMLNVVRWDTLLPIVAINNLYEFPEENRDIMNAWSLDINNDCGTYCLWELGIANHEKEAWKKYLASEGTKKDKINYLENSIEGKL